MLHPIGLYFLSIIIIGLWCAGFRKLVGFSVKEITVDNPDKSEGAPLFIRRKEYFDKMLLWKLGVRLSEMGMKGKPLGSCISCMPSIHGTIIYWLLMVLFVPLHWILIPIWPLVIVSSIVSANFFYRYTHG